MNQVTFIDHMTNLREAHADLVTKIADATCTSKSIVYRWIKGTVSVPLLKQKIISEIIGKPIEELFPEANNQKINN